MWIYPHASQAREREEACRQAGEHTSCGVTAQGRSHVCFKCKMHKPRDSRVWGGSQMCDLILHAWDSSGLPTALQKHSQTNFSQLVCIFIIFPRGRKQSADKLHSYSPHVNFTFRYSYDGFNFTLISLEGKSITEKNKFLLLCLQPENGSSILPVKKLVMLQWFLSLALVSPGYS